MKKGLLIAMLLGAASMGLAAAQTNCPVMGGPVNHKLYVDADGYRIYVCCETCVKAVKKDPGKYIKKMQDEGVEIEKTPPLKK